MTQYFPVDICMKASRIIFAININDRNVSVFVQLIAVWKQSFHVVFLSLYSHCGCILRNLCIVFHFFIQHFVNHWSSPILLARMTDVIDSLSLKEKKTSSRRSKKKKTSSTFRREITHWRWFFIVHLTLAKTSAVNWRQSTNTALRVVIKHWKLIRWWWA
jgi:hypothetical protein